MDQDVLSLIKFFLKKNSRSKKELSMEIHEESLKGQYVSICIYLDLSLLYVLLIKIDQCFPDHIGQTIFSVIQIFFKDF